MLDLFLKLMDKLVELVKAHHHWKTRQFTEGVASVYDDIEIVHTDYLAMFEFLRSELRKGSAFTDVAEKVLKDRTEREALRRTVAAIAMTFEQNSKVNEPYRAFFGAVARYFDLAGTAMLLPSASSEVLARLNEAAWRQQFGRDQADERARICEQAELFLSQARERWLTIADAYAAAKATAMDR